MPSDVLPHLPHSQSNESTYCQIPFSHPIRITLEKLADIAILKKYILATYKPFYVELILGQEKPVVVDEVFDASDNMLDF